MTVDRRRTAVETCRANEYQLVCYRYQPAGVSNDKLKAINTEIMLRLQEEGTAIISDTTVRGAYCLRAAITIIEPATMI